MESTHPLVTVILPVYNGEQYICESIQSILGQTFTDFELIVIDDASTDNTRSLIRGFGDPRLQLVCKPRNTGYTDSLNRGLAMARGTYIARMDADDISHPERLQKQVGFLDANTGIALCGTWYLEIPENHVADLPVTHEDIKIEMLSTNAICHPSIMFRKAFFNANNLSYNRDFETAEDYELWTRLIAIGRVANIPEVLLHYRIHHQQVSTRQNPVQLQRAARCRRNMLCYLLETLSAEDSDILERLLAGSRMRSAPELQRAVALLDGLVLLNNTKGFYKKQEFIAFIEKERIAAIRNFFIFHREFSWRILRCFYSLKNAPAYLTPRETVRLVLKSLAAWKVKTAPSPDRQ